MKIRDEVGLSFDDVLLVPRKSDIKSRFDGSIDLSVQLTPSIKLKLPIISAAMDTISEVEMVNEINRLGGLGLMHRFMNDAKSLTLYLQLNAPRVLTIGLGIKGLNRLRQIVDFDDSNLPDAVHIDVAYAWTPQMIEFVKEIKSLWPKLDVIVGSIANGDGICDLANAGVDAIRVGVGPGSKCDTRRQTGNGFPLVTALMDAYKARKNCDRPISIICDGGVVNAGDCVKAMAAGADAIMTGRLLAGTNECPVPDIYVGSKKKKEYRGMSSIAVQSSIKQKDHISIEGVGSLVDCVGSVEDVLTLIRNGILSGFSYQGAHNIGELQKNAEFVQISPAGVKESGIRE